MLEPRKSAYHYLTTWFPLDFVSSTPPVIELIVYLAASGAGDESSTSIIKVLRVLKIVKIVRIAKLVKLTDPNSALADAMEDLFLTSHWAAATCDAVWYSSFDCPRGRRGVGFRAGASCSCSCSRSSARTCWRARWRRRATAGTSRILPGRATTWTRASGTGAGNT